jgi:multiple sugar transport system ATP-binding protein
VEASQVSIPVPQKLRAATAGKDGQKVVAGIRPENVGDTSMQTRGETGRLQGEVEIVEPLGHEVIVHARVGERPAGRQDRSHRAPQMGAPIELVLELDALHLFDATTEGRMGDRHQ